MPDSETSKEYRLYRFMNRPQIQKLPPDKQAAYRAMAMRDLGLTEDDLTAFRADPFGLRIAREILPMVGMFGGGKLGGPAGAGLGLLAGEMGTGAVAKAYGRPARIIPTEAEARGAVTAGAIGETAGRLLPEPVARLLGLRGAEHAGVEAGRKATGEALESAAEETRKLLKETSKQAAEKAAEETKSLNATVKGAVEEGRKSLNEPLNALEAVYKVRQAARQSMAGAAQSRAQTLRRRFQAITGRELEERTTRKTEEQAVARLQALLGQTPTEARAMANRPITGQVASTIGAVRGARQRGITELGLGFKDIFESIESNLIDLEGAAGINQHVRDVLVTSATRGEKLAPATVALTKEIQALTPKNDLLNVQSQMDDWLSTGKTGDPELDVQLREHFKAKTIERKELAELITAANVPPNIGRLRGLNARVLQAAEAAPSAVDRRVLLESSQPIRDILDHAVPDRQKPILAALKAEYRQLNKQLPWWMIRRVNKASSLPEIGDLVFFKQPADRALRLIREAKRRGDPSELALLRSAFAARVLTQGDGSYASLEKALSGREAELSELFGASSPFGTKVQIIAASRRRLTLEKQIRSDPQALNDYRQGLKTEMQKWLQTPRAQQLLRERQAPFAQPLEQLRERQAPFAQQMQQLQQLLREQQTSLPVSGVPMVHPDLSQVPAAIRQGQIAALQAHAGESGMGRYIQHRLTFDALAGLTAVGAGGYGAWMRDPEFMIGAGIYLLRRHAWAKAMETPAFAAAYRDFLFSPTWQARGVLAARLLTAGVTGATVSQPLLEEPLPAH